MKMRPGVISGTTSRDLAEVGIGYSASGASEHSRQSAHSANAKLPSHASRKDRGRDFEGPRYPTLSLGEKIAFQTTALVKLNIDLILETNPDKQAKLRKNVEIKTKFLDRLKVETTKR